MPDSKLALALLDELESRPHEDVDGLQQVSADRLIAAYRAALQKPGAPKFGGFGPTVDGRVIPTALWGETAPDVSADVPMIIGTNLNEFVNAVDNPNAAKMTDAELMAKLTERYQDKAVAIAKAYRKEYPQESPFGIWATVSASETRRNAITQAEKRRSAPRLRSHISTPGARPRLKEDPARFIAPKSRWFSTTPTSASITLG